MFSSGGWFADSSVKKEKLPVSSYVIAFFVFVVIGSCESLPCSPSIPSHHGETAPVREA